MLKNPVSVTFWTKEESKTVPVSSEMCVWNDIALRLEGEENKNEIRVLLSAGKSKPCYIAIRFETQICSNWRILGDEWERSYGEMAWQPMIPHRRLPWYFLITRDRVTCGAGVKVRPGAMCFWQVDEAGVTLVMDVRCGGTGVSLGGRALEAAVLVWDNYEGMHSFEAARLFCKKMCRDGIFPDMPVYGSNNWYYAYGNISEKMVCEDADCLKKLTEGIPNRPYMVIDDGWQKEHVLEKYNGGPWRQGNAEFPDMKRLASEIQQKNVIPGIWIRLLLNETPKIPKEQRLSHNGCLDPSHPEVLDYIEEDVRTLCEWGYRLIKHDFSTYDILGKWGFEMQPFVTGPDWAFSDAGKTTAEIIKGFYGRIYRVAKEYGCLVLGCNTIGHLGAGMMHLHRTGDDTSGLHWDLTRRNGVNALAFRMPQHGIFFDIDADCVGFTEQIDWKWNRQWAKLLAHSGTPLFLSVKPGLPSAGEEEELRSYMKTAAEYHEPAKPLDWEDTACPACWDIDGEQKKFQWYTQKGILYGDF